MQNITSKFQRNFYFKQQHTCKKKQTCHHTHITDIPPLISTRAFVLAIFSRRSRSRFSCASFTLLDFSSASLSFAIAFDAC